MKKFFVFAFLFLMWSDSHAKDDSVFVKINADTVQIWNTDVSSNCASKYLLQAAITGNAIVITECDTVGPIAHCNCIFDLHTSLTGLTAGHYTVAVYRQLQKKYFYSLDTTIFIDSLEFTLGSSSPLSRVISSIQSACHAAVVSIKQEESHPKSLLLLSNYPNPFNPSTIISYQLATNSFVTLKVFDILGNEIATLVNEEQQAGNYSVKFDATNNNQLSINTLPSGIYFYQLRAGDFIQTRKMLVLK